MKTIKIKVSDSFNADENEVVIIQKDGVNAPCEECENQNIQLIGECGSCGKSWTLNEHSYFAEIINE